MNPLIERLDGWFRAHRPNHYSHLLPGTTDQELSAFERRQTVQLPPATRDFFRWRNGEDMHRIQGRFQNNWSLMPLEEVEATCDTMRKLLEAGEFDRNNWWSPGWIPFLANGGGDHLCVDLTGSFNGRPGQVLEFFHDYESRTITFPSFEKWLEFFVTTLEQGLWSERSSCFEMEGSAFKKSMNALCPGYPVEQDAG